MVERANSAEIPADDLNWRDRSEYWRIYKPVARGAAKKFKYREPLILNGHGVRIRVDHNTLLISNGFTHYPQKTEEIRFFPGEASLPNRIFILDGSGGITLGALSWMSDQEIVLVQLNWRGELKMVGGGMGYSANSKLADAQLKAKDGLRALNIARWLISEKIAASVSTLNEVIPKSAIRDNAIARLEVRRAQLRNSRNSISAPQLLGIEGDCAAAYFRTWHGLPIKWSGLYRNPIPNNWREISPRMMTWRRGIQNARHPINAMLNYGYGIMKAAIQGEIIATGLNPSVGVMHSGSENKAPLVYDLMEPLRPLVDRKILEFAFTNTFTPGDFAINNAGGCRLNPHLAKVVASQVASLDSALPVGQFLLRL